MSCASSLACTLCEGEKVCPCMRARGEAQYAGALPPLLKVPWPCTWRLSWDDVFGCCPGGCGQGEEDDKEVVQIWLLEAQLQSVATCRRAEPRDLQAYADAVRATLPQGILLVHEDLRACFLFRASQPPRLFNFACALALLHSGTAACFALLRRDRMRRVSVRRKH